MTLSHGMESLKKWAEGQGDVYDKYDCSYIDTTISFKHDTLDTMWVNTFPTPSEQFTGMETWVKMEVYFTKVITCN